LHRGLGFAPGGSILLLVLAIAARVGRLALCLAAALVLQTCLLQSLLDGLADDTAVFGGLHALDGLLIAARAGVQYARARPAVSGPARPARAITAAGIATVLVALAGLVLIGLEWGSLATSGAVFGVGAVAGVIAYAALGALIVRRAGNLAGRFMLAEGPPPPS